MHPIRRRPQRCLGRNPSRRLVRFKLTDYVDVKYLLRQIPDPNNIGHIPQVPLGRGYLNQDFGCCVVAGAEHEHDTMGAVTGRPSNTFTDATTIANYAEMGGFDPTQTDAKGNNPTDQGCDMEAAATHRRKIGILDKTGARRKIDAFVRFDQGNLDQLRVALHLFMVGGGLHVMDYMFDETDKGQVWNYNRRGKDEGGHYTFIPGMRNGNIVAHTWGQNQIATPPCWTHLFDENLAYYSQEQLLASGKSLEGFDHATLMADIERLAA